MDMMSVL